MRVGLVDEQELLRETKHRKLCTDMMADSLYIEKNRKLTICSFLDGLS